MDGQTYLQRRVLVSRPVSYTAGAGTSVVAGVSAKTLVTAAHLIVTEAFAGTNPALSAGTTDNDDCWVDSTDADAETAGSYRGDGGQATDWAGQYYPNGARFTVTIIGTDLTAGGCRLILQTVALENMV